MKKEVREVLRTSRSMLRGHRRGTKLPKPEFYDNLEVLFVKLCNPVWT